MICRHSACVYGAARKLYIHSGLTITGKVEVSRRSRNYFSSDRRLGKNKTRLNAFYVISPEFFEMIKHWLIIGLCSILTLEALFPNVDLSDLSHVPDLLAHYQEHRKLSPDVTVSEFLRLHYSDPGHLATSPADHQKLPFSKRQHHRVNVMIAHDPAFIRIQNTGFVLLKKEGVFHQVTHTNRVSLTIWQPPRA